MRDSMWWKRLQRVSLVVLAIGIVLVVVMVRTESEPGALPLLLVLLGAVGYGVAWFRTRAT